MTFIIIRTSEPEFRLKEHLVLGRREDLYQFGEINVGLRLLYVCPVNRGSSVSIVSGYGLDDLAIEVRSPAEAKGFFL
jgi:hypothetical protein